ncbi:MAG: hypothetical protein SFX19_02540 [Alphaproteobacteria bacterium]|nr:hypothetical protein [Alphaproteobacteria bacterium]
MGWDWTSPLAWPAAKLMETGSAFGGYVNKKLHVSGHAMSAAATAYSWSGDEETANFYREAAKVGGVGKGSRDPFYSAPVASTPAGKAAQKAEMARRAMAAKIEADTVESVVMPLVDRLDGVRMAYDTSYNPPTEAAALTREGRAEQTIKDRARVDRITATADALEITKGTAVGTGEFAGGMVAGTLLFKIPAIATTSAVALKLSPLNSNLTKATGYAMIPDWLTNPLTAGMNADLATKGEAPMRSAFSYIPALKWAVGDAHYVRGGTPDTHPEATKFAARQAPANDAGDAPPLLPYPRSTRSDNPAGANNAPAPDAAPSDPKDTAPGGFHFGIGSLIGALLGVAAMFANPLAGAAILVAGLFAGQKIDAPKAQTQRAATAPTPPPPAAAPTAQESYENLSPNAPFAPPTPARASARK